jgi:hypothetical protein
MADSKEKDISFPEKGLLKKTVWLIRYHFHAMLFLYIWFGLVICGLAAPDARVELLGSCLITKGWHLSVLSTFLVLPWPIIYFLRFRTQECFSGQTGQQAKKSDLKE